MKVRSVLASIGLETDKRCLALLFCRRIPHILPGCTRLFHSGSKWRSSWRTTPKRITTRWSSHPRRGRFPPLLPLPLHGSHIVLAPGWRSIPILPRPSRTLGQGSDLESADEDEDVDEGRYIRKGLQTDLPTRVGTSSPHELQSFCRKLTSETSFRKPSSTSMRMRSATRIASSLATFTSKTSDP